MCLYLHLSTQRPYEYLRQPMKPQLTYGIQQRQASRCHSAVEAHTHAHTRTHSPTLAPCSLLIFPISLLDPCIHMHDVPMSHCRARHICVMFMEGVYRRSLCFEYGNAHGRGGGGGATLLCVNVFHLGAAMHRSYRCLKVLLRNVPNNLCHTY